MKKQNQPTHVILPAEDTGLEYDSMVLCENPQPLPKDRIGKTYSYDFGDGWVACISVIKLNGNDKEYRQLKKRNAGFCGYNWMVDSIIVYDEIVYKKE